jgi:hypothetical protein
MHTYRHTTYLLLSSPQLGCLPRLASVNAHIYPHNAPSAATVCIALEAHHIPRVHSGACGGEGDDGLHWLLL